MVLPTRLRELMLLLPGDSTATLKNGIGASVLYPVAAGLTVGAAYHQNEITDVEGDATSSIKNGDTARIGLVGLNYSTANYFLGMTFHTADSWEVAGNEEFFDSRGGELYTHYHFDNGFRATFNANYMTETDGRAEGYERKTYTPGVEYHSPRILSYFGLNTSSMKVKTSGTASSLLTLMTNSQRVSVTTSNWLPTKQKISA